MKDKIESIVSNAMHEYGQLIEKLHEEAVFNYADPVLKMKGKVTLEKIGKKLQWRGIRTFYSNIGAKSLIFVTQRNIIISRLMVCDIPNIFTSPVYHPFFKQDWRNNLEMIKYYMGMI